MLTFSRFLMLAAALLAMAAPAAAKITPRTVGRNLQFTSPVVLDLSNTPHVFYQGADYRIYHTWRVGAGWQREPIETAVDAGFGISAAADSRGTLHVSYGAYRGGGMAKLVYARRDPDSGWTVTDVGVDGTDTAIAIDALDRPHIYFAQLGQTAYAYLDAGSWIVQTTGLPNTSYRGGLVVDDTGTAHVAYALGLLGLHYATNDSGDWVSTLITQEWGYPSIALDSNMNPHIVLAAAGRITHFSRSGDDWQSEVIVDTLAIPDVILDQIALAIGPDDSLHLVGGASIAGVWQVPFYVFPNGEAWAIYILENHNAGYRPFITPGRDGVMHATYSTRTRGNASSLRYAVLPLADLSGQWTSVSIREVRGRISLDAAIEVRNSGADTSAKAGIAVYLSDDDVLSDDDLQLSAAPSLKSLRPGASTIVRVRTRLSDADLPAFLIAHLDPVDAVADSDATNNIIVTPLPP